VAGAAPGITSSFGSEWSLDGNSEILAWRRFVSESPVTGLRFDPRNVRRFSSWVLNSGIQRTRAARGLAGRHNRCTGKSVTVISPTSPFPSTCHP